MSAPPKQHVFGADTGMSTRMSDWPSEANLLTQALRASQLQQARAPDGTYSEPAVRLGAGGHCAAACIMPET
jgi:hypothetical protein